MDSFEVNKIAGGVLGTLLATMGLGIAASWFYEPSTPAKPGYDLPLAAAETSGAGDSNPSHPVPAVGSTPSAASAGFGMAGLALNPCAESK